MSNIQVFGTKKCKTTGKAERFFKERGIKFQFIDLKKKALSPGELRSIKSKVPLKDLIDTQGKEYEKLNLKYIVHDIEEKLLEHPLLLKTPIVRRGKDATVGFEPDTWKSWI